MTAKPA
jgi:Ca2+-binding EF-hand superfamily protein